MKPTLLAQTLVFLVSVTNPVRAYLVEPLTPAAPDTIQDCSNWVIVAATDKCEDLADANSITLTQFEAYNPSVGSSCNLDDGNSYCTEQNWGIPLEPTSSPALTTSTKPNPTNGVTTPTPTQSGMADSCNKFYLVKSGDGCFDIAANNSVTLEQFYNWNPAVGECENLWPKYYVCVGIIGLTPTPTVSKVTPINGITTPTPTQGPFITNCNKFYLVKSGDGCEAIATANGISFDQFYSWNPAVGQCTSLWPKYYVCVGIISSTTLAPTITRATSTNGITTPTPTQSGMIGNCDTFYKVLKNDGCEAIASKYSITTSQFYAWNPSIESTCKNLWPDYYVCVSVLGVNPTFTTSVNPTMTQPGNGVATPTPIQVGMTKICKKFYKVTSGDSCWAIANTNKIDLNDFYAWNPAVKTDCSGLWPDYFICISV